MRRRDVSRTSLLSLIIIDIRQLQLILSPPSKDSVAKSARYRAIYILSDHYNIYTRRLLLSLSDYLSSRLTFFAICRIYRAFICNRRFLSLSLRKREHRGTTLVANQ